MTNSHFSFEYEYVPPQEPPDGGAEWEETRDYPGVRVTLSLPTTLGDNWELTPVFACSHAIVLESRLEYSWGSVGPGATTRQRSLVFWAATLKEAEAQARAAAAEAERILSDILLSRAARLARREATIAHAHSVCGEITPPASSDGEEEKRS